MDKWKKNIILFMLGQSVTLLGSMLVQYAVLWHITLKTESGVMMMLLTLVGTVPMFLISPFGGVWADRYNKKHLINIADAVIAFVTLVMAIMFSLGYEYIGLLLVCSAMRSFGQGIQTPSVNALIPEIVPQDQLTRINGISGSVQALSMLVAPMLAGTLLSFMSVTTIMFIDVITAIIGISLLYFFVKVKKVEKKKSKISYFHDLKEGLVYTKKHVFIKKFLVLAAVFNLMMAPVATLTPLQVARDFGSQVWRLTSIEIAFAIGMLIGGIVMGAWGGFKNKSHSLALAGIGSGVAILFLGLLNNFWVYIVFIGIAGILISMFNPPMMSILQTNVDEKYMGRVFSLLMMISSVAMPIGMLVWGPLSDVVKIDWLLIGTGFVIFLSGFVFIYDKIMLKAGLTVPKKIENESL